MKSLKQSTKPKEDATRKILNNLFESFASAQKDQIEYANKVNEFINKKLNK